MCIHNAANVTITFSWLVRNQTSKGNVVRGIREPYPPSHAAAPAMGSQPLFPIYYQKNVSMFINEAVAGGRQGNSFYCRRRQPRLLLHCRRRPLQSFAVLLKLWLSQLFVRSSPTTTAAESYSFGRSRAGKGRRASNVQAKFSCCPSRLLSATMFVFTLNTPSNNSVVILI